jgi:hypothetical protein
MRGAEKALEDVRSDFGWNPGAAIRDRENRLSRQAFEKHTHRSSGRGKFNGVFE